MAKSKEWRFTPVQHAWKRGKQVATPQPELVISATIVEKIVDEMIKMITTTPVPKAWHQKDWHGNIRFTEWFEIDANSKLRMEWEVQRDVKRLIEKRVRKFKTDNDPATFGRYEHVFTDFVMKAVNRSKAIKDFKAKIVASSGTKISALQQEAINQINREIDDATKEVHKWNEKRLKLMIKRGLMTA